MRYMSQATLQYDNVNRGGTLLHKANLRGGTLVLQSYFEVAVLVICCAGFKPETRRPVFWIRYSI